MSDFDIERWVDIHGHDSHAVKRLVSSHSSEKELETYLYVLLNTIYEEEAIQLIQDTHEEFGDLDE